MTVTRPPDEPESVPAITSVQAMIAEDAVALAGEPVAAEAVAAAFEAVAADTSTGADRATSAAIDPTVGVAEPQSAAIESTPGATKSEAPPTGAAEPASAATNPTASTAEPANTATNPTANATEPASAATNPTANATEPANTATNPTANATEPANTATNPTAGTTEPSKTATDSTGRATQPANTTTNTTASAAEPASVATGSTTGAAGPSGTAADLTAGAADAGGVAAGLASGGLESEGAAAVGADSGEAGAAHGVPEKAAAEAGGRMSHAEVIQALSGLMLGMFVAILASTIVSNALPRIIADLGGSQSVYTWIVTTELLSMTATVPLWGKLADLYSKKLLIQVSLSLFVVGSLIAGFTPNVGILIVSRVAQGVGAGGMSALAMIVMAAMIPPRELGRYSGLFGAVFGVATIAGPLIGGVLVDTSWLGWRWCFFIGVPFSLAAIALLQKTLHLPSVRREVKIDWLGAGLITAGVSTLLIWSTLAGQHFAWASAETFAFVAGGLVLLALAVLVESRAAQPVIPLRIFRNRTITLAIVASILVGVAMFGGTIFLSQYFQIALGKSPTVAGLMSLPMIFGLLVSSTVAGQLITKFGRWKAYLVAGAVIMTGGLLLLSRIDAHTSVAMLSIFMAVLGIGVGMLMQNLVLAAQNDVAAAELGAATSSITFFRSMGGAIGVSALGAVLADRVTTLFADKFGAAATSGGTAKVPDLKTLPPEVLLVVKDIYATATSDLFLVAAPTAFLAVIAVLFIKEKPLSTLSGEERRAKEEAAATGIPVH